MAPQAASVDQLIELFIQATLDSTRDPKGTQDAAYWQARATLEVARQIERLETTLRTAFCEWREIERARHVTLSERMTGKPPFPHPPERVKP